MDQPDPREIGQAIDAAIESMEELNEWRTLKGWGGTPEIINDFIKGQQSRIYAAQEAEQQRDRLAEALDRIAVLYESKEMTGTVDQRIADAYDMRCMARSALAAVKGGSDGRR
jgi:hypothetical protein